MANYRGGRINEEFKKEISNLIANDIRDPRINGLISVTGVNVTKDLRYAKVYISILGTIEEKKETLEILKKSAGFMRKRLAEIINLRYTPELIIELDSSIEHGMKIDAILEKIKGSEKS